MNKKSVKIFLLIIMVLCVSACVKKGEQAFSKKLKTSNLSIKDFEWETKQTRINGTECYAMTLTNKSKYDIIAVQIDYKVKENVTEEELKVYDSFIKKNENWVGTWIEENSTTRDITLVGRRNILIKKGESVNKVVLAIGIDDYKSYDVPNEEQFNLMEPKMLQIGVVGEDNKLYIAYYDYVNKTWTLDELTKDLNVWPKNDLANKLLEPDCEYYIVTSDEDTYDVDFTAYGSTKDSFKEYVKSVKETGFTEDALQHSDYYSAKDKEGNRITIDYDSENLILEVNSLVNKYDYE